MVSARTYITPLLPPSVWLFPTILCLVIVVLEQFHFVLFHSIAELFSIFISMTLFAFAWSTHAYTRNGYLMFIATAFFWIGVLDLFHTAVYKGFDVFVVDSGNLSSQFWIGTRYLEATVMLFAPFFARRNFPPVGLFVGFGLIAVLIVYYILAGIFPTTYIDGQGLTPFKIYSEYAINGILLAAFVVLVRANIDLSHQAKALVLASIVFTMISELAFTFYIGVYDFSNLVGHVFKIYSFWLIFQAIVMRNLHAPYKQLQKEKKRFQALFDNSYISIWDEDLSQVYSRVQELKASGISDIKHYLTENRDEVMGLLASIKVNAINGMTLKIFHADNSQQFYENMGTTFNERSFETFINSVQAIWNGETHFSEETEFVRLSGQRFSAIVAYTIPLDEDGFRQVPVSILDVSDRDEAGRIVDQFFNQALVLHMIAAQDGTILRVNRGWEKAIGYTPHEMEGRKFLDFVHPDDLDKTLQEMQNLDHGQRSLHFENRYRSKDGTFRLISWSSSQSSDGTMYYATATDVTDLRRSERDRKEAFQNLKVAERIAHLGNWTWNIQTGELKWSDEIYRIFGVERDRFKTTYKNFLKAVHPDDRPKLKDALDRALAGKKYDFQHRFIRPDGSTGVVHELGEVTFDDDGKPLMMIGAVHDISDRVELEQRVRQIEKMDALGNLAGGIAHDVNNMLLPIIALTDMTLKGCKPESPEHRRLEKVSEAAHKAQEIVSGILTFSRSEQISSDFAVIDFCQVYEDSLPLLKTTLPSSITIVSENCATPLPINADASQLTTVIMNLASNSADALAGRAGHFTITLERADFEREITISGAVISPGSYAHLYIADDGKGMNAHTKAHLFDPFFTTKGVGEGTGLGMSMVYGIITRHKGIITVLSEPDQGAKFDIFIPLSEGNGAG